MAFVTCAMYQLWRKCLSYKGIRSHHQQSTAQAPEISTTQLVIRCRVPPRVAVATSVFTLAIVALVGATVHALSASPPLYVVGWSIPGVLVGSTIGSRIGSSIPARVMEKGLGVLFGLVGILVLVLEFGT